LSLTAWAVLFYLLLQFGIGIWASRRIATEDDYLVAGRKLGYPLGIFSIFATWFGAETCIGAASDIAANGISVTTAEPFGYGLCIILMGLVFAVPLWKKKLTTLADLFRDRYSIGVERVAAIFLIPTSLFWSGAQIRAFGSVLSSVTELEIGIAIGVAAGIVILYTAVGGLLADAVTDLVQGVTLVVGLVVVLVASVLHFGGPAEAVAVVRDLPRPSPAPVTPLETLEAWAIPVLGSVVATELIARVIATRTPTIARRSAVTAGGIYVAIGLIPAFIGLVGAAIVPDLSDPEQLLPAVAEALLPSALYAIFAGALISAILSTVDSALLIASGLLSHNILLPLMPRVEERTKVRMARLGVAGFGVIAFLIAVNSSSVMSLIEQSSAFGSAGTLVIVCFGLFSRLGGPRAAMAALFGGMGSYIAGSAAGISTPYLASLAVSLVAYVAVAVGESMTAAPGRGAP
jgi:Na+/proline symporter